MSSDKKMQTCVIIIVNSNPNVQQQLSGDIVLCAKMAVGELVIMIQQPNV